jgi:hypothetical protein
VLVSLILSYSKFTEVLGFIFDLFLAIISSNSLSAPFCPPLLLGLSYANLCPLMVSHRFLRFCSFPYFSLSAL